MAVSISTRLDPRSGSSVAVLPRILISAAIGSVVWLSATHATAGMPPMGSQLRAQVTTNKGCLETGDAPTFMIGERIVVILRIESSTFSHANATLLAIKPNGFVNILGLGSLVTNQFLALAARVGAPAGAHELLLKASADGLSSARACTFNVVGAPMTRTPKPSAMATNTPTMTPTVVPMSPSATPATALRPHITTNRGCEETGQHPTFGVGEPVTVSFDVASDVVSQARATLFDFLSNGFVNAFSFGTVATNHTFSFHATIAPPTGIEVLQLRASAFGVPSMSSFCSFSVVHILVRTRTPTPTATLTPTSAPPPATATPTPTATPT
jgi:hypothetical protein